MDVNKILETIKYKLINQLNCDAIILFGSYARETQTEKSDIDIAVKLEKSLKKEGLYQITQELEEIVKIDIDLVNLEDIQDGFRYEILINGKVIFCKDEYNFELYKLDRYREYLELSESRQEIINRIKEGGSIYGK